MNGNTIQGDLIPDILELMLKGRFESAIAVCDKIIEEKDLIYAYQLRATCLVLMHGDSFSENKEAIKSALSDTHTATGILSGFLRNLT